MRVEHLEYFVEVVKQGSIAAAAAKLFISPQGLSQAIQKLEQELGIELFARTANRLTITRGGEVLYANALKVLESNDELQTSLNLYRSSLSSEKNNRLIIYTTHAANISIFPKILPHFHKLRPSVKIQLIEKNSLEIFSEIPDLDAEPFLSFFGLPDFEFERIKHTLSLVDCSNLLRCPLSVCMAAHSPLSKFESFPIDEIKKHPLILYSSDILLLQALLPDTSDLNIILNSQNFQLCKTMTSMDKYAIGLTSDIFERYHASPTLISRPITPRTEMVFGCFTPHSAQDIPDIQLMRALIEAELFS